MKQFNYLSLVSTILALSACVSVDDFKSMSADERAVAVCQRQSTVRSHQREIDSLRSKIATAEQAISLGYHKVEQCEERKVPRKVKASCNTSSVAKTQAIDCEQKIKYRTERDCEEMFLPADQALEKANIQRWQNAILELRRAKNEAYQACYRSVVKMSAEEAFLRY